MGLSEVKILGDDGSSLRVGGYGVVFHGQDVVGDTFLPTTDLWLDKITATPPVLFDHGGDPQLKRAVVGRVEKTQPDDIGLWIEAKITANAKYRAAISRLVKEGVLGWSSGAVGHLVDRAKNGVLNSWAIAEFSLTPTPAEPRTLGVRQLKSLATFEPALTSVAKAIEGSLEDRIEDICEAASELLGGYCSVVATYDTYAIVSTNGMGDTAFWRIPYTIGPTGDPVLGDPQRQDMTFAPAAKGGPPLESQEQPQLRGAAAKIAEVAAEMHRIALDAEEDTAAMERLGTDTKDAHRFYSGRLAALVKARDDLTHLIEWAQSIDEGEDGIRRVNFHKHRLALIELEASA